MLELKDNQKVTIQQIAASLQSDIPNEFKREPWKALSHRGKDIITDKYVLDCYFVAHSKRHEFCANQVIREIPKEVLSTPFYAIDWGCGQGIGSLVLLQYLNYLGSLDNLAGVYLIDPSEIASKRAKSFIDTWIPEEKSKIINHYFHDNYNLVFKNKDYPIIHLFSNILDIDSIDFHNLAQKIVELGHFNHYIAITSPNYQRGRENIKYFLNFFSEKTIINEVNTYNQIEKLPYDYYSILAKIEDNNILNTDNISIPKVFSSALRSIADERIEIIYKPFELYNSALGQESIDFLIMKEGFNACFLNIVEEKIIDIETLKEKIKLINTQRDRIIGENIPSLATKGKISSKYYSFPYRALYLAENSAKEVAEFKKETQYCTLLSKDDINNLSSFLKSTVLKNSSLFNNRIYDEITNLCSKLYHYKEEGKEITFKNKQINLLKTQDGSMQKVKGFAGSGKTLVLVHRAVKAHKRTSGNVLILTYNITINNYIRQKLNEVYEDFDLSFFTITNYHKLIKETCAKYTGKDKDFSDIKIFEGIKNRIKKYDAIFIDEGQDFQNKWLQIIMNDFTTDKTEIVVFADEKQNIYDRELGLDKMPKVPNIKGRWNELQNSYRLHNKIISLALDFQKHFDTKYTTDIFTNVKNEQESLLEPFMKYEYLDLIHYRQLTEKIATNIQESHIQDKSIGILLFTHDAVQKVDYFLRKTYGFKTNSMCITKEEKDDYDNNYEKNKDKIKDIESLKRIKKEEFVIGSAAINISTIHSFKGWEVENLFIILGVHEQDYENKQSIKGVKAELIYTAITRCKEKLFILSMDKEYYHDYFENCKFFNAR